MLYATPYGVYRYSREGVLEKIIKGPKLNSPGNAAQVEAFTRLPNDSFAIAGRNDVSSPTWSGIEWFTPDGVLLASIDQNESIIQLAAQADGKLVVLLSTSNGFVLERYLANGQLDSTFSNDVPLDVPVGTTFLKAT